MDETQRFLRNGKCFKWTIENFNELINEGAVEGVFGEVCSYQWYTNIGKISREGVDYLSIDVMAGHSERSFYPFREELYTEVVICVKNENPDRWEKCQGEFKTERNEWIGWEKFMRMDTILDPESGFLRDDGSLVIQIEIRVHNFIDWDGTRIINFLDPFEGCVQIQYSSLSLYTCKKMLIFHSSVLAEQLALGRDEIVFPNFVSRSSVENFIQLIHGVKMEVSFFYVLDLLYIAHKYQVLTVLRQLEVQIKGYPAENIHYILILHDVAWIKTLLGEKYHEDLLRMIDAYKKSFSEEYKELSIRKREMLLAITRAPFTRELDSD